MVDAITSTVLILGTFRLVFSGSFFPCSWNGQWNNRPLGSFEMNTLVREVVRTADKNTSHWNLHCVRVRTLSIFPLRVRSQGFDEAKYQLGGWIYCCSIVQHK